MFLIVFVFVVTLVILVSVSLPLQDNFDLFFQQNADNLFVANIIGDENFRFITISPFNWIILNYLQTETIYVFFQENSRCDEDYSQVLQLPKEDSVLLNLTQMLKCWPGTITTLVDNIQNKYFNDPARVLNITLEIKNNRKEDSFSFTILDAVNQLLDLGYLKGAKKQNPDTNLFINY
jgi:hypothetical protein